MTQAYRQSGATLVEFAVVLPVFLLIFIGALTYGIAFVTQQAVSYAAQRSADSLISIAPGLDSGAYETLAARRVEERIASTLAYFPGADDRLPQGVSISCDAPDPEGIDGARLCIRRDKPTVGRSSVAVRLAVSFESLWPRFPTTDFISGVGRINATGYVVVTDSGDDAN